MTTPTTDARVEGTLNPVLADLRRARTLMDDAWHRFPDSQPANARTFTNWIRAISAIDVTIAEIEDITANNTLTVSGERKGGSNP